ALRGLAVEEQLPAGCLFCRGQSVGRLVIGGPGACRQLLQGQQRGAKKCCSDAHSQNGGDHGRSSRENYSRKRQGSAKRCQEPFLPSPLPISPSRRWVGVREEKFPDTFVQSVISSRNCRSCRDGNSPEQGRPRNFCSRIRRGRMYRDQECSRGSGTYRRNSSRCSSR